MKKVIYIYGTKGGVGKTTLSVSIATLLRNMNKKVVLVDMDISGPNIHNLIYTNLSKPLELKNFKIYPAEYDGIGIVSTGLIFSPKEISYFSGKYLEGLLHQMVIDNDWDCQYIIIDMPPGFDEIHRILFTSYPGQVLLVTTPQRMSYENLERGIKHLNKLDIKILGVVENMSWFECSTCKKRTELGNITLKGLGLPIIKLPFDIRLISKLSENEQQLTDYISNMKKEYAQIIKLVLGE